MNDESLRVVLYSDGSFVTNKDEKSQLGYVIIMEDKNNKGNLID